MIYVCIQGITDHECMSSIYRVKFVLSCHRTQLHFTEKICTVVVQLNLICVVNCENISWILIDMTCTFVKVFALKAYPVWTLQYRFILIHVMLTPRGHAAKRKTMMQTCHQWLREARFGIDNKQFGVATLWRVCESMCWAAAGNVVLFFLNLVPERFGKGLFGERFEFDLRSAVSRELLLTYILLLFL